jgi:hypothetical protein
MERRVVEAMAELRAVFPAAHVKTTRILERVFGGASPVDRRGMPGDAHLAVVLG